MEIPQKIVESKRSKSKVLWHFQIQIQTDKQPDKDPKTAVVIDVAMVTDNNIRKKEYEILEKYHGPKEDRRGCKSKGQSSPSGRRNTQTMTSKWERLQQIPGMTKSELSVQKNAVLGTAKSLHSTW